LELLLVKRCLDIDRGLSNTTTGPSHLIRRALEKEQQRIQLLIGVSLMHEIAHLLMRVNHPNTNTPSKFTFPGSSKSEAGDYFEEKAFTGTILGLHREQVAWDDTTQAKIVGLVCHRDSQDLQLTDSAVETTIANADDIDVDIDLLAHSTASTTTARGVKMLKSDHSHDSARSTPPQPFNESRAIKILRRVSS
jgi:hypothetical protein